MEVFFSEVCYFKWDIKVEGDGLIWIYGYVKSILGRGKCIWKVLKLEGVGVFEELWEN